MNYRHAFHAGNFADVLKHVVLALVIERLKLKEAPFRVIDTHAGPGLYDLGSDAASRTQEWRSGIGRLIGPDADPFPPTVAAVLEPYLAVVRALNPPGALSRYPGSPRLARALMRPQDRLVANELHPEDGDRLTALFRHDDLVRVMHLDGWTALKSLLPPKERRGVVLVDPPFEEPRELDRMTSGLGEAVKRFATGIYLLWYPIKDPRPIATFRRRVAAAKPGRLLAIELLLHPPTDHSLLNGCGVLVCNPPFQLDDSMRIVLPALTARLSGAAPAQSPGRAEIVWLTSD